MLKQAIVIAVMLALCTSAAIAAPNLNGASGLVQMPDASVATPSELVLSAAYVESDGSSELTKVEIPLPCEGDGYNLRLLAGLGGKTEIGVGFLNIDKSLGDADAFTVTLKTVVMEIPKKNLTLALGASYRDWSSDLEVDYIIDTRKVKLPEVTTVYLALDKAWEPLADSDWAWKGTLGVSYDEYDSTNQDTAGLLPVGPTLNLMGFDLESGKVSGESFVRPFFGLQGTNGDWTVMAEYKPELQSAEFKYASEILSLAVNKKLGSNLGITAGFTNFNLPYTDSDGDWFVDLAYTLSN